MRKSTSRDVSLVNNTTWDLYSKDEYLKKRNNNTSHIRFITEKFPSNKALKKSLNIPLVLSIEPTNVNIGLKELNLKHNEIPLC